MSDDHRSGAPSGADGWVRPERAEGEEPYEREFLPRSAPAAPLARRARQPGGDPREDREGAAQRQEEEVRRGKGLALLSHGSVLFGLPVFLIPLVMRDNRFALHHAKAAAVNFILFAAMLALTFGTCGIFLPAMLLCYVPALVGVVLASSGERAGPFAFGNLGERLFARITVKEDKA